MASSLEGRTLSRFSGSPYRRNQVTTLNIKDKLDRLKRFLAYFAELRYIKGLLNTASIKTAPLSGERQRVGSAGRVSLFSSPGIWVFQPLPPTIISQYVVNKFDKAHLGYRAWTMVSALLFNLLANYKKCGAYKLLIQ